MAKSRRSRSRSYQRGLPSPVTRDATVIANPESLFRLRPPFQPPRSGRSLQDVEDRRTFSPGRLRPSRTPRQVARITMRSNPSPKSRPFNQPGREVLSFRLPKTVAVCVRRAVRKQVIHARGVAGGSVRPPRRNQFSSVSCRRK